MKETPAHAIIPHGTRIPMKTKRKPTKPKRGSSPDAPASDDKGAQPRKEAFALAEADGIHDLMDLNGPRVAKWALQCVQKAARGRASLFEQKIALLMIQKCTPSTGRKTEDGDETLPEGTTKEELRAIDHLIEEQRKSITGPAAQPAGARARVDRESSTYQVRSPGDGE